MLLRGDSGCDRVLVAVESGLEASQEVGDLGRYSGEGAAINGEGYLVAMKHVGKAS